MKIRMTTGMAGNDFALAPGETTDRFSDEEAQRMIDAGLAEKATKGDVTIATLKKDLKEVTAERDRLTKENEKLQDNLRASQDALVALQAKSANDGVETTDAPAVSEVRG